MPHSNDPFTLWSSHALQNGEMNHASVSKYASLWKTWCAWMVSRQGNWQSAHAALLQEFLDGASPGSVHSSRKPINDQKMSSYTRQRYWRLLRGVYATAVHHQLLKDNPALDLQEEHRPSISRLDRQSQILEPFVFQRLTQAATLRAIIELTSEDDWWHVRDRAAIAILASTGLTSQELLALRGMDVRPSNRSTANPNLELDLGTKQDNGWIVDVMESSTSIARTLPIRQDLAPLVRDWVKRRETLLLTRSARTVSLQDRTAYLREHDSNGPFLVSRRAKGSTAILPPREQGTLYYLVSQTVLALRQHMGLNDTGGNAHVAKGPAVIRNSVIRGWLDHVGSEETVQRAGLKNVDSLRLYLTPQI